MIIESLDRPRSQSVVLGATIVDGETRWDLSISDLTTDELDTLLPRLTQFTEGGFKAYLESDPEAGRYARTGVAP